MEALRLALIFCLLLAPATRIGAAGFAMSDNFTVLTPDWPSADDAKDYAQEVLESAEQWRSEIAREWLGRELPPGVGQTTVNVSHSTTRDAGLTWVKDHAQHDFTRSICPPLPSGRWAAPWPTRWPMSCWRRDSRIRIGCLPGWKKVSPAVMTTRRGKQHRHEQIAYFRQSGQWPRIDSVLTTARIAAREQELYTVAASVTEFLLSLNSDKNTLLEFGQCGNVAGWDTASRRNIMAFATSSNYSTTGNTGLRDNSAPGHDRSQNGQPYQGVGGSTYTGNGST